MIRRSQIFFNFLVMTKNLTNPSTLKYPPYFSSELKNNFNSRNSQFANKKNPGRAFSFTLRYSLPFSSLSFSHDCMQHIVMHYDFDLDIQWSVLCSIFMIHPLPAANFAHCSSHPCIHTHELCNNFAIIY